MRGREALAVLRRLGASNSAAITLEIMAWTVQARGHGERAAAVLGAASALRESGGISRDVLDQSTYEETLATVRAAAGEDRFAAGWARGRALALDAAIAEALPQPGRPANAPCRPACPHGSIRRLPLDSPTASWRCCGWWRRARATRRSRTRC